MCGIVGYIGPKNAQEIIINGLKRLEYRGYDSAGVAILNGTLQVRKQKGKVNELAEDPSNPCDLTTVDISHMDKWSVLAFFCEA